MSLQPALHDSEIACEITAAFDGVWWVRLGHRGAYDAEERVSSFREAELALLRLALKHYPSSAFSRAELATAAFLRRDPGAPPRDDA